MLYARRERHTSIYLLAETVPRFVAAASPPHTSKHPRAPLRRSTPGRALSPLAPLPPLFRNVLTSLSVECGCVLLSFLQKAVEQKGRGPSPLRCGVFSEGFHSFFSAHHHQSAIEFVIRPVCALCLARAPPAPYLSRRAARRGLRTRSDGLLLPRDARDRVHAALQPGDPGHDPALGPPRPPRAGMLIAARAQVWFGGTRRCGQRGCGPRDRLRALRLPHATSPLSPHGGHLPARLAVFCRDH